jgi:Zn-dependent M28 family amino/carboxypeptidase
MRTVKADVGRIFSHVEFLTSLKPARSYQNVQSLNIVADYISHEFTACGGMPEYQKWKVRGREYKNVIASYNRGKSRRLVVGAHYDVCGEQPGADDNASAVAGLLELYRMIMAAAPMLEYQVDFVGYCLEEPPFFATEFMGSYVHAKSLHAQQVDVMGMICLEMIGYFSDEPNSQPFPTPALAKTYPNTANFIIVVGIEKYADFNNKVHLLMAEGSGVDVQVIHFPTADGLGGLSDQRSYWQFGYQALMINDTAFVRNPNYHTVSDTIDTLDFPKMAEVINSTLRAVTQM